MGVKTKKGDTKSWNSFLSFFLSFIIIIQKRYQTLCCWAKKCSLLFLCNTFYIISWRNNCLYNQTYQILKQISSEWNVYGNDTKLIVAFRMFILLIYAYACLKKLNDVARSSNAWTNNLLLRKFFSEFKRDLDNRDYWIEVQEKFEFFGSMNKKPETKNKFFLKSFCF